MSNEALNIELFNKISPQVKMTKAQFVTVQSISYQLGATGSTGIVFRCLNFVPVNLKK